MSKENEPTVEVQNISDILRLADRELIEKFLLIAKAVHVNHIDEKTIRVSFDLTLS